MSFAPPPRLHPPPKPPKPRESVGIAALFLVLTLLLFGRSLGSGWAFDDPGHVAVAAQYAPWQYFFVPEVMLRDSYAHIAPWSTFFFELGLPFFGLDARGHHLHLLLVIGAIGFVTWRLLREQLSPAHALAGGLLWLATPNTGLLAHTLMTAHYAYGLLLSLLALWLYWRALETSTWRPALGAAAFYALACLCKELYVPLPAWFAVLHLLHAQGLQRTRLRLAVPTLAVAAAYVALRLWVLGGIGGYADLALRAEMPGVPLSTGLLSFARGWLSGLGLPAESWPASVVAGLAGACVALAVWAWRPNSWRRLAALLALLAGVLIPLLPLLSVKLPLGTARLLVLLNWLGVVGLVWGLQGLPVHRPLRRLGLALVFALLPLMGWQAQLQRQALADAHRRSSAELDFMAFAAPGQQLVPHDFENPGHLRNLQLARQHLGEAGAVQRVLSVEQLVAMPPLQRAAAQAWNEASGRVEPIHQRFDALIQDWQAQWARACGQAWQTRLSLQASGRSLVFRWKVEAPAGAMWIDVLDYGRVDLPHQGVLAFGVDQSADLPERIRFHVNVRTHSGAWLRSPELSLSQRGEALHWSGEGAALFKGCAKDAAAG